MQIIPYQWLTNQGLVAENTDQHMHGNEPLYHSSACILAYIDANWELLYFLKNQIRSSRLSSAAIQPRYKLPKAFTDVNSKDNLQGRIICYHFGDMPEKIKELHDYCKRNKWTFNTKLNIVDSRHRVPSRLKKLLITFNEGHYQPSLWLTIQSTFSLLKTGLFGHASSRHLLWQNVEMLKDHSIMGYIDWRLFRVLMRMRGKKKYLANIIEDQLGYDHILAEYGRTLNERDYGQDS